MDSDHKFTHMVTEFQISSLIELLDSFSESTLYRLPTATKAWCIRRDNDCRATNSEQYKLKLGTSMSCICWLIHRSTSAPMIYYPWKRCVQSHGKRSIYYLALECPIHLLQAFSNVIFLCSLAAVDKVSTDVVRRAVALR